MIQKNHIDEHIQSLRWKYQNASPQKILEDCIHTEFKGEIALLSSFGTESVILLHMVSLADKSLPIIFLDTYKLFPKTIEYKNQLIEIFDLQNVMVVSPEKEDVEKQDKLGTLWQKNPNQCCYIRKVKPLKKAMEPFRAQINGRKRYHGFNRSELPLFDKDGDKIQINPLVAWDANQLTAYIRKYKLPKHPLTSMGYTSVGCIPCTERPVDSGSVRSGRWKDQEKKECGIHYLYKDKDDLG